MNTGTWKNTQQESDREVKEDAFSCQEGLKSWSYQSTNGQRLFFPEDQHQQRAVVELTGPTAWIRMQQWWERNPHGQEICKGIPQHWQGKKKLVWIDGKSRDCLRKSSAAHLGTFWRYCIAAGSADSGKGLSLGIQRFGVHFSLHLWSYAHCCVPRRTVHR